MKKALLLLATMFLAACGTGGTEGTQTGTLKLNVTESTAKTVELGAGAPDATHVRLVVKNASPTILPNPIIVDVLIEDIPKQVFQLPVAGGYTVDVISYYKTGTSVYTKYRMRKHGASASFDIIPNADTNVPVTMINLGPQLAFKTYSATPITFLSPGNPNARIFASSKNAATPTTFENNHRAFYNITSLGGNRAPLRPEYGFFARTSSTFSNNTTYATVDSATFTKKQSPATNISLDLFGRGEFYLKADYLTNLEKMGANYRSWVYTFPNYTDTTTFQVPVKVNAFHITPGGY